MYVCVCVPKCVNIILYNILQCCAWTAAALCVVLLPWYHCPCLSVSRAGRVAEQAVPVTDGHVLADISSPASGRRPLQESTCVIWFLGCLLSCCCHGDAVVQGVRPGAVVEPVQAGE